MLAPERDAVDIDDVLAGVSSLIDELNGGGSPGPPDIGRRRSTSTVASPAPALAAPPARRETAPAKEAYQCLICGSTIPADARHCRVCGTIFLDESQASSFRGVPVTRIGRSSEIEPGDHELGQAHRTETVRMDPVQMARGAVPHRSPAAAAPCGAPPTPGQPRTADELPNMEVEGARRPVVKKKIIKKKD
jgi:hypothetical protein